MSMQVVTGSSTRIKLNLFSFLKILAAELSKRCKCVVMVSRKKEKTAIREDKTALQIAVTQRHANTSTMHSASMYRTVCSLRQSSQMIWHFFCFSDTTDLCCNNCQYRPANYTCRPAVSECDVAEVCSGDSGDCPSDSFVTDGESCGNGLYCASGQCTSRDLQCRQRGSVMNVTRACGAIDGCQLACDNPHGFGCILFNGNFLDGTPCGVGGACKAGSCSLDNFGTNAKNWINDHLYIVIPVAAVVGLLLLCCISRCILYGCCGYGGYRAVNKGGYVVTTAPQQPYSAYPPPYSAQPYYAPPPHSGSSAPGHWVDPSQYNGTGPTLPSAAYAPGPGQIREAYEMNSPETWRSNSVSPAPRDGGSNGNISGRVRRFEEQMGSH